MNESVRDRVKKDIPRTGYRRPLREMNFMHRHPKFSIYAAMIGTFTILFGQPLYNVFFPNPNRIRFDLD